MTPRICAREPDVLALVSIGQWPRQADAELLAHVSSCTSCAETMAVASALVEFERDDTLPVLPDARAVWQRAQWRARQDAMVRAARPVVAMQGVAAFGVVALIVVATGWLGTSWSFGDWMAMFWNSLGTAAASISTATVAVADLLRFETPTGILWLLAGLLALGLTTIGVAVALSTLADLQEETRRR